MDRCTQSPLDTLQVSLYRLILVAALLLILASVWSVRAEDELPLGDAEAQTITIAAEDNLLLVGDFYLVDPNAPTLLLLHQLYTNRSMWDAFIRPFLGGGYNLLAVDLRGYGMTRGRINWDLAQDDTQSWMAWLRHEAGVRPDGISIIGSSMGANLALLGCADDELCRSAVAISPGWRYFGVGVSEAFGEGLAERPALLIYAERDRYPALGVPEMMKVATNPVDVIVYPGNLHGLDMMADVGNESLRSLIDWLNSNAR